MVFKILDMRLQRAEKAKRQKARSRALSSLGLAARRRWEEERVSSRRPRGLEPTGQVTRDRHV